jgi:acetoin utilization deacetylase AcuC-like enzyme
VRLFSTDHHEINLPAGHRFPIEKYRMLREALLEQGLASPSQITAVSPAAPSLVVLAHSASYVDAFLRDALDPKMTRRIGFPWSEQHVKRTLASVEATWRAAQAALNDGYAGALAGGTHHASADAGEGFCVFNDLAIAIRGLQAEGKIKRAAVIDLDVHQGNGTAAIFRDDPDVFTLSIHGARNYPFHKIPSSLDVGLEDGVGDDEYLSALLNVLDRVFAHRPELVLYQAGVDALEGDRFGRLKMSHAGLMERDLLVLYACQRHGCPVAITAGGGYATPVERTVEAYVNTYRAAHEVFEP